MNLIASARASFVLDLSGVEIIIVSADFVNLHLCPEPLLFHRLTSLFHESSATDDVDWNSDRAEVTLGFHSAGFFNCSIVAGLVQLV